MTYEAQQHAMSMQERQPLTMPVVTADPMEMLSRALQQQAAPETLEKLLVLQERWERNMARKAFDKAIAAAKAELPVIVKNREVNFGSGRASYKHEDLAEIAKTIVPVLSKHGLSYRWRTHVDDKLIVVTCIVSHEGGHSEETSLPAPADTSGSKNSIQAIGSTVTYLQRYTLKAALGLAASKDDDAVGADQTKLTDEQVAELTQAIVDSGRDVEWFCDFAAKINSITDLPPERYDVALAHVRKLPKKVASNGPV